MLKYCNIFFIGAKMHIYEIYKETNEITKILFRKIVSTKRIKKERHIRYDMYIQTINKKESRLNYGLAV